MPWLNVKQSMFYNCYTVAYVLSHPDQEKVLNGPNLGRGKQLPTTGTGVQCC